MSTSGNTSWELTRNQLIEQAYAKLGIPGEDNTLSTTQYDAGAVALNMAVQLAVTDGMPLWKRTTESVNPSATSQVYTFTTAMKIKAVYIKDTASGSQYELFEKSLYDFMRLPQGSVGVPVHWTSQSLIQGYTVSIWPLTSDSSTVSSKTLQVVYQKEFDGFTSSVETPDFPAYWIPALVYQTAVLMAPEHGTPLPDRQALEKEVGKYWAMATGMGDEDGSIYFQPERRI